jgi:hypothetical protein
MKHFPIGFDDFAKLTRKNEDYSRHYHFVDKSLLIKEVLASDADILLLARPRRFGKTMNMSMLSYFFDIQRTAQNRDLFTGLKIASATIERESRTESCMNYQGKYPVIFLTFKECGYNIFQESYAWIKYLIKILYETHSYLLNSEKLTKENKKTYKRIINREADDTDYNDAIRKLTEYLYIHYDQKVIVLIDEYDAPFQTALYNKYYSQLLPIMKVMLGGVLKGNKYLEKAVLTGILRISGAGIFSGANNVRARTVLDHNFSEYFGFTEEDINKLLTDIDKIDRLEELRNWYDGYQFGNTIIYNPWSVMECISQNFDFSAHWVNTSDDKLIKELLLNAPANIHKDIGTLISDQSVEVAIYNALRFDEDLQPTEHLWTLLLSTGYLKSVKTIYNEGGILCNLKIPNKEISYVYTKIFAEWLGQRLSDAGQSSLIEYLLTGQAEEFGEGLKNLYLQTVSVHNVREDYIEAFYHGFMVGIIGLSKIRHSTYLYSDRESGLGRYDLVLEPRDLQHPKYHIGIILEFKRSLKPEILAQQAQDGLAQIKELKYATDLQTRGVNKIIMMSIAFCGKEVAYIYEQIVKPQPTVSAAQFIAALDSPITTKKRGLETNFDKNQNEETEKRPRYQSS